MDEEEKKIRERRNGKTRRDRGKGTGGIQGKRKYYEKKKRGKLTEKRKKYKKKSGKRTRRAHRAEKGDKR